MAGRPGPKAAITAEPLDFSTTANPNWERGWPRIVSFAEHFLKVPKGAGAKEPFRLRDWQIDILKQMFPAASDGVRRPRQGLISLPRGNGKTALAAVLAVYALFADEEEGAQILIVASDERQAGHVFRAARRMIETSPELEKRCHFYNDRIYVPHTDSELRPLPADVGALQGWDPSLMIVDELHVVTEDVWEAVTSATGKRAESMTLAISTPADNTDSVMWRLVEWGRSLEPDDEDFVFIEYGAPAGCEIDDEAAWYEANPALGDFLFADAIKAKQKTLREAAFRRYHLGQWVGQEGTWLEFGMIQQIADRDRVVGPKEKVVLAFDGSASGDATALIGATVEEEPHIFTVAVWENPSDPRWRVPREEVLDKIDEAFATYNVVELAFDPWGWRTEFDGLAKKHGKKRVIEWNTAWKARMAPATDRAYALISEHRCTTDGNATLETHFGNCVATPSALGDIVHKDKKTSPRKIDAAVAGIVALDRAAHHQKSAGSRVRSFSS